MLASSIRSVAFLGLLLAACDGGVEPQPSSNGTASGSGSGSGAGAGAGGGAAGAGGSATGGAAVSSGAGGQGGIGGDCENGPTYLQNLLDAAAACNAADPSLHCQDVVDGYCCPAVVESVGSPATQAYLDFLHLSQAQCPEMWDRCNAVDCALPQTGNCVPDGQGNGKCEPHPL
ncbi:MAG: hypothetical protein WKG00_26100 [Polyangiaceae bacterium]